MEINSAKEVSTWLRDANKEQCNGRADGGVDTILDGREDGDEDGSEPDEELERGYFPE